MSAPKTPAKPDPESILFLSEMSVLLNSARGFPASYDAKLRSFRQSNALWRVVSGAVLDYLEGELDLDRNRLNEAEKSFYSAWVQSPPFHELESQLAGLIDASTLAFIKAFRRPPSLREVHVAVNLPTKAKRLAGILAMAIATGNAWVAAGKGLPVRQVRSSRNESRRPRTVSRLPKTWWEWLGVVAAFLTMFVALPPLLGVGRWEAVGLGFLVIGLILGLDFMIRWYRLSTGR